MSIDNLDVKLDKIPMTIISQFTEKGVKFYPRDLIAKNKKIIPHACSSITFQTYHYKALAAGVSSGILSKTHEKLQPNLIILPTIQYWQSQLRGSKYKNLKNKTLDAKSTKGLYLYLLNDFNEWLVGKTFNIRKNIPIQENIFQIKNIDVVFNNVEEFLKLFEDSPSSKKDIIKIIRSYLTAPIHNDSGSSYMNLKFSAIMSYFEKNESPLSMRFDSKTFVIQEIKQDSELTLDQFYDMLTIGQPTIMIKSIMLVKFQAGFDSSTLADRFNFEGFQHLAKYFGSVNHNSWDLDKCPAPLNHIRIKNNFQHTPLLDRDAIIYLQKYLDWRISKYGPFDTSGPIYLNKFNRPITANWISDRFSELAKRTGIQKKISKKMNKIRAHEVRDLLKSTLIDSGCRMDIADHVIGHRPKDSYEKQTKLYPETIRKEYSKASKRLNIFTKFTSVVNGTDDSDELKIELKQKMQVIDEFKEKLLLESAIKKKDDILAKRQMDMLQNMQRQIDDLSHKMNSNSNLQKNIEFCCIDCSTVHDSKECPACGSKLKRIFEDTVKN